MGLDEDPLSYVVRVVPVPGKAETPADDLLVVPLEQLVDPDSPVPAGRGQVPRDQLRIGEPFQLDLLSHHVTRHPGRPGPANVHRPCRRFTGLGVHIFEDAVTELGLSAPS